MQNLMKTYSVTLFTVIYCYFHLFILVVSINRKIIDYMKDELVVSDDS